MDTRYVARIVCVLVTVVTLTRAQPTRSSEYEGVQRELARGWNTWDTHSVTTHVLLPEGFALRVGLKHNSSLNSDAFLSDALIGRLDPGSERVTPGPHSWNGSYTELRLSWKDHEVLLQSAHDGDDFVLLATPLPSKARLAPTLILSAGVLWNRPGWVSRSGDQIIFSEGARKIPAFCTAADDPAANVPVATPYFAPRLVQAVGVSTGRARSVEEIQKILERERPAENNATLQAIETVLGWDTIYEPSQQRVISPVSRIWNLNWGGYVLFDWDTFFAAAMASTGNRALACANAVEIVRESTAAGFVPNYARAGGWKSVDRSEPPVGAITILGLYRKYNEAWLLRDTFDGLLRWNRWWAEHRDHQGYLVWASDADAKPANPDDGSVGGVQGAKYESGLDNSPMFDDAPFHADTHALEQADVGLMGLYIADCDALADIATVLGKSAEASELRSRSERYRSKLQTLWDDATGIYRNKNLDTGQLSPRLSPTNFYPLLARAATPAQAKRMIREHLLNPAEFWGEWVIPAIARSDPAFRDQEYWRGRIWGPMNYLVYLGLQNYDAADVRKQLAEKSRALFEVEWTQKGHVHENYNAITGQGDDVSSSDRFYHWGALLGYIDLLEKDAPPAAGK